MTSSKHGSSGYRQGCRCEVCKLANTEALRSYRAKNRTPRVPRPVVAVVERQRATMPATVTTLPEPEQEYVPGPVEQAVIDECATLSTASTHLVLVETAKQLARILDTPGAVTTQPSAAAKIESIMERLRRGADTRKARLSSVRKLNSRTG